MPHSSIALRMENRHPNSVAIDQKLVYASSPLDAMYMP